MHSDFSTGPPRDRLVLAIRLRRSSPSAERLGRSPGGEGGQSELAAPAPGLAREAVGPLQLQTADPGRRAGAVAGEKVEGSAHPHLNRYVERRLITRDPS